MANEGSTKPTYRNEVVLRMRRMFCCKGAEFARPELQAGWEEIERLETSLARVRGLLQRQWISVEERLPETVGHYLTAATMFTDETIGEHVAELSWDGVTWRELHNLLPMSLFGSKVTHWRELPELPSGAESADAPCSPAPLSTQLDTPTEKI